MLNIIPSRRSSCGREANRLYSFRALKSAFVRSVCCIQCPVLCHLLAQMLKQKVQMQCDWLQFTGHIKLPIGGLWSFSLSSDDSSLLYIDGALFINNDGTQLRSSTGCWSDHYFDCCCSMAEAVGVSLVCCRARDGRRGNLFTNLCLSHVLSCEQDCRLVSAVHFVLLPSLPCAMHAQPCMLK